jgi:glycosyltransferase involved in cell wall biosynthesis
MKVLFSIHHILNADLGAPGATCNLARELSGLGCQTEVFSMSNMGKGVENIRSHLIYPWFTYRRLSQSYRDYDVLDLSSGDGWILGRFEHAAGQLLVARSHGLEHIAHLARMRKAGDGELNLSWKYRFYHGGFRLWEVAESFRRADLSFFLNSEDYTYAIEHLRVSPERARITSNGIANELLGLPFSPEPNGRNEFRIVLIGSYSPRKIHSVPPILNKLLHQNANWSIGFLGTGVDEDLVRKDYARELQGRIQVIRHYPNKALPGLLRNYDVLLFPSLSEGFGLAVFEAMACGLAVVASRLPALQERLVENNHVIFINPGDTQGIEAAITQLASDYGLLRRRKQAAYCRAQDFSWHHVAEQTLKIYDDALNTKRRRAEQK